MGEPLRAIATIVPDETRVSHVHTRVAGWIEQLFINTTGQSVRSGQPLAGIFSQELLSSQTEYLAAKRAAHDFIPETELKANAFVVVCVVRPHEWASPVRGETGEAKALRPVLAQDLEDVPLQLVALVSAK